MRDALLVSVMSLVPKKLTARLMGFGSRARGMRALHRVVVRWYVRHYDVDLDECQGTLEDYPTLAQFFVRPLREGVRPIDTSEDALVSPVDGRVSQVGTVDGDLMVQAHDRTYTVGELLGQTTPGSSPADHRRFEGGSYAVLYLSPRDYHRVHCPREGRLTGYRYLPGRLWPVFPAAVRRVDQLFARNERLVLWLDTDAGHIAEILVGAFGVGRMTSLHLDVVTNTGQAGGEVPLPEDIPLDRADEVGRFELGSTVILLLEPGRVRWEIEPDQPIRLGQRIGTVLVAAGAGTEG
ncbi:MAG: archaetidylserine decarboxylase [Myxococcota bacterium]|jgi:phosphatidylserine decarboxylase|nr:archaetidylserine decarboxylase [Myxococcota bacterium]